jgi:hypothetical protein
MKKGGLTIALLGDAVGKKLSKGGGPDGPPSYEDSEEEFMIAAEEFILALGVEGADTEKASYALKNAIEICVADYEKM